MKDPLEGLDGQEREWLANIAQAEGLTLEQARQRRDQSAERLSGAFRRAAEAQGISEEEIEQAYKSEKYMIEFTYKMKGVKFPGRFSIAAAADTGERVLSASSRGHENTHGTEEDKIKRWGEYQNYLDELMQRNKSLSLTEARRKTAVHFDVSAKTIQRHTESPK
ncbi:hypothetical protein [Halomonas salipaludis]|uniref:Uncharacterized protein n=1 Tax=Halomonas salipaludis TaxID=2032625 RepID=A0A2A2F2I9_9GAMM|nr:hypothetical protein [Halomonas salipaludis]PAU78924.1 hypothetical protein CK498_00630 [Halomonas salipaludis]